ncbi:MAG: hypothetical protein SF053_03815 [Bacteroidia bacterium]|nr:hypothetical protein [Bacteroidia bacterium]
MPLIQRLLIFLVSWLYFFAAEAQSPGAPVLTFGEDGIARLAVAEGKWAQIIPRRGGGYLGLMTGDHETRLIALTADGIPDVSWASEGQLQLPSRAACRLMTAAPDGGVYIGGTITSSTGKDLMVLHLLPEGTLDPDFGQGGMTAIAIPGQTEGVMLETDDEGRIWVAGHTFERDWESRNFMMTRLMPDGRPDPDFGQKGVAIIDIGKYDLCRAAAADPRGGWILAGTTRTGSFSEVCILRVSARGQLDKTFGQGGYVRLDPGLEHNFCEALALQRDGMIYLMGHTKRQKGPAGVDWMLVRLRPDGVPDPTFGQEGMVFWDLGGVDYACGLTIQPDGYLVLAGTSNQRLRLLRTDTQGQPDPAYGIDGWVSSEVQLQTAGCMRLADESLMVWGATTGHPLVAQFRGNPSLPGVYDLLQAADTAAATRIHLRLCAGIRLRVSLTTPPAPGPGARMAPAAWERHIVFVHDTYGRMDWIWTDQHRVMMYHNGHYTHTAEGITWPRPAQLPDSVWVGEARN